MPIECITIFSNIKLLFNLQFYMIYQLIIRCKILKSATLCIIDKNGGKQLGLDYLPTLFNPLPIGLSELRKRLGGHNGPPSFFSLSKLL